MNDFDEHIAALGKSLFTLPHEEQVFQAHISGKAWLDAAVPGGSELANRFRAKFLGLLGEAEPPGAALVRAVRSLQEKPNGQAWRFGEAQPSDEPRHFFSGCELIDLGNSRGFYGVTTIAGATGLGKSSLACSAAVEAAAAGWQTFYVNTELDPGTLDRYLQTYARHAGKEGALEAMGRRVVMEQDFTAEKFFGEMETLVKPSSERMLAVIDSINTATDLVAYGEGYFEELKAWVIGAMRVRAASEGKVSFILVSELNRRNEAMGGKILYTSDLVVYLTRDKEHQTTLEVAKGRFSGYEDHGAVKVNPDTRCLEPDNEDEPMIGPEGEKF